MFERLGWKIVLRRKQRHAAERAAQLISFILHGVSRVKSRETVSFGQEMFIKLRLKAR